jgi:hypothetical protein
MANYRKVYKSDHLGVVDLEELIEQGKSLIFTIKEVKQREVSQKKYAIDVLKEQIFKMNNKKSIKVSEHAILRYLERISGLEIDNIEKLILNDEVLDMINKLGGNGAYPTNEFKVVLKNYVVTTIIPLK